MPAFKELPLVINGFKVIKDLGCFDGRRYLIAECKVCKKHFKNERDSLRLKHRRSCGCLLHYPHKVNLIRTNIPKKLRSVYISMILRCYDHDHMNFKSYGAKGIKVYIPWMNNNNKFYQWALANGYKDNLTLDRIDPSKGYEPKNCRFVTMAENIQSRRTITKFNPDIIRQMRQDCKIMTTRKVAEKYKVSHHHLIDIKLKRAWSNVED